MHGNGSAFAPSSLMIQSPDGEQVGIVSVNNRIVVGFDKIGNVFVGTRIEATENEIEVATANLRALASEWLVPVQVAKRPQRTAV